MSSGMATAANRHAIADRVAEAGMFSPCFDVVGVQSRRIAGAAIDARPVVAVEDGPTPCLVRGIGEVGRARWPRSTLPVGMCGADQVGVPGRDAAGCVYTCADSSSVLIGERPPGECSGDVVALRLWQHTSCGRGFAAAGGGDLRAGTFALGRVADAVLPRRSARARAKALAPIGEAVRGSALFTDPQGRH